MRTDSGATMPVRVVCQGWFIAIALDKAATEGDGHPHSSWPLKPSFLLSASKGIHAGIMLNAATGAKSQPAPVARAAACMQCMKWL